MLIAKEITKGFGGQEVLSGISLTLGRKQKAGLVGQNGVGKSTLLKIMAGLEMAETGNVEIQGDAIGYLPQQLNVTKNEVVESYIKSVAGILDIEERMQQLEKNLNNQKNQEEYVALEERYMRLGGYGFEHRMNAILEGVRFG